jgi:hypothetical protein
MMKGWQPLPGDFCDQLLFKHRKESGTKYNVKRISEGNYLIDGKPC